jgi:hypothetical protein
MWFCGSRFGGVIWARILGTAPVSMICNIDVRAALPASDGIKRVARKTGKVASAASWRALKVYSEPTVCPFNAIRGFAEPRTLAAFVTTSDACAAQPCFPGMLWSYRIRRYDIPIAPAP